MLKPTRSKEVLNWLEKNDPHIDRRAVYPWRRHDVWKHPYILLWIYSKNLILFFKEFTFRRILYTAPLCNNFCIALATMFLLSCAFFSYILHSSLHNIESEVYFFCFVPVKLRKYAYDISNIFGIYYNSSVLLTCLSMIWNPFI